MAHPRAVVAAFAVMTLLAVLAAATLRIDPNVLSLLPDDDPSAQAIRQLTKEEKGANLLTITVQGEDPEALHAYMTELRDRVEASEYVDYALYDLPPDLAWRVGVVQLSVEELTTIRNRLQGAVALGPTAANPFVAARLLDLGPLTDKLSQRADQSAFLDKTGGMARLIVRPKDSPYNPQFTKGLMGFVYGTLDALDAPSRGLEVVWIGGAHRHAREDVKNLTKDLGWTGAVSFMLVLLLLGVAFRQPRALLFIFGPLVVANVLTAGFAGVAIGTLNTFTSFFPAILVGLGVDFSIHLYSRYREERAFGGTLEDAIVRAWDKAGPPCLTAGLTTAGGFCALWVASFKGFQQLGTILAGGVMLCLVAVVTLLPLLIRWRDSKVTEGGVPTRAPSAPRRPPTYPLAPLGLLAVVGITAGTAFFLPDVEFEYDLSELRPEGLAYEDLDQTRQQLATQAAAPVVVSFASDAELREAHTRLTRARADGELGSVEAIVDIYTLLPLDQAERVALLREVAALAADPNVRYLPMPVQENLARLTEREIVPLSVDDLPYGLQHVVGAADGRHRMMLMCSGNLWDLRENRKLFEDVQAWLPGVPAAGEYLALAVLYDLFRDDTPKVAGVALLLVFIMTLIDVRKVGRALGAVLALLAGMAWAAAAMVLLDLKLSMVNFVGVPILMGIGVDVVIHLLHRLSEEGPGRVRHALSTTGWASGLSAATTILSFASLSVATARGTQGLGLLIVLGLTLVAGAGLVLVPLGWMTAWKVRGDLPKGLPDPETATTLPPSEDDDR